MIKFIMNGLDVSAHVESAGISKSPVEGGNGFTDVSGNVISDITADKESLKIKLNYLSAEQLTNIISELDKAEISVDCNIIRNSDVPFICDGGYNSAMSYAGRTSDTDNIWEMDFTLSRNIKRGDGL